MFNIKSCTLCPRNCMADRTKTCGFCGASDVLLVANTQPHEWEEPCISGSGKSGTVFFSNCSLKCCYCQNYEISTNGFGKNISTKQLADIFKTHENNGAHNINLVTATPYIPWIISALEIAKLKIPVVYNTSGYETLQTIQVLSPYIDIWLTDLKYVKSELSEKYSNAHNYFSIASNAIMKMAQLCPKLIYNEDEILLKGLIVRHLVLPNNSADSLSAITWLSQNLKSESFLLSLMSQYTPCHYSFKHKELSRRVSTYEYKKVLNTAVALGLTNGYVQNRLSAMQTYTPKFCEDNVF